jgi:hypothetical protein
MSLSYFFSDSCSTFCQTANLCFQPSAKIAPREAPAVSLFEGTYSSYWHSSVPRWKSSMDRNAIAMAIAEIWLFRKVENDLQTVLVGFFNAGKHNTLFDV